MDFTRIFDILPYQGRRFPQKIALAGRKNGQWHPWSTEALIAERDRLSAGLLALGYHRGDCVGILAHCSSPQWCIADVAMMQIGMVPVPIHSTARPDEIEHIIRDSSMKACFVSDVAMLEKLAPFSGALKHVFAFGALEGAVSWQALLQEPDNRILEKIQYYRDCIGEHELATVLYTSGTTGTPKGVMLSHANIVSNVKAVLAIVPIDSQVITLSFLPMSHIFERMVTYGYMAAGCPVWFADTIEDLSVIFREVRPILFTSVPRVIERMYERLIEQRDKKGFLGKKIFDWALRLGERYPYSGKKEMPFDYYLKLVVARWLVFNKFRKALGGRVRYITVGAAALQPRLGKLLSATGIEVREGYGLTETSPVVSFNRFEPGGVHFGTVGIPVPGVSVRIANPDERGDGEIEVYGPNVMMGYLNLPEETAARMTADGWLKTGDVGQMEFKRFLRITGRQSEIFKTTTGKFVAPQFVEQQLLSSPFVTQCIALGLNQPYVGALIVPNFKHLEDWCRANKVHWTAPQFMVHNPKVEKLFMAEVARVNDEKLGNIEKIRAFRLLHEPWTAENGLLTPTQKLRRQEIVFRFSDMVGELFA